MEDIKYFAEKLQKLKSEIEKVIVGHKEVIHQTLISIIANGHVLLEGVPGLGKTLFVKTLSKCMNLKFSRIQFTPDLMPADIIGTNIIMDDEKGKKFFQFLKGPIFANIILADEINRATPKTQSALLEAMQERSVTAFGNKYTLEEPFFVLATQNPIEMEGTFPLPEAQMDRFFFKVNLFCPDTSELEKIIDLTTGEYSTDVTEVITREEILKLRVMARSIPVPSPVKNYIARIIQATHPKNSESTENVRRFVKYGASPRGAQTLALAGKINALIENRTNVSFHDIKSVTMPALRHRIILNFDAEAEGIKCDDVLKNLIDTLPDVPKEVHIFVR